MRTPVAMRNLLKKFYLLTIIACLLPMLLSAQVSTQAITKIVYRSSYGGMYANSYLIRLEIEPNGIVSMYSNVYDDGSADKVRDLLMSGSQTISAKEFQSGFAGDSLTNYYTGKISITEYSALASLIVNIQGDTIHYQLCCCDIPERRLKVYCSNYFEQFMECGGTKNANVTPLMDMLDKIANKKGYTKAKSRFYFE